MNFRQVRDILEANGISFKRNGKGSHRIYEGIHNGKIRLVILSYNHLGEDVKPGTLAGIIRQSGLPKRLFR